MFGTEYCRTERDQTQTAASLSKDRMTTHLHLHILKASALYDAAILHDNDQRHPLI